jgi:hypothetical protein
VRAAGEFTDSLEDDLADAQKILGLGPREAEDIRSEIVSKTYKCALPLCRERRNTASWRSSRRAFLHGIKGFSACTKRFPWWLWLCSKCVTMTQGWELPWHRDSGCLHDR